MAVATLAAGLPLGVASLALSWKVIVEPGCRRDGLWVAIAFVVTVGTLFGAEPALTCAVPSFAAGCINSAARRKGRAAQRARTLRRQLPQALQLLSSVLDGGAPTAAAIEAVARRSDEPLATGLRSVVGPGQPGGHDAAMRPLAALVRASEELGTPLAAEVRTLADDTREAITRDARLRAAAAGPKMMLVIGCLLAPASLLLIVGSEVLTVIASMRGIA